MNQARHVTNGEGNKLYTGTEYDSLTGYVTQEYCVEWTDDSGTRWRKRCVVTNLGRPDRGTPPDPNFTIADDGRDYDGNVRRTNGPQRRTVELLARIRTLLADKPLNVREIADALGETNQRIHAVMRDHSVGFVVVAEGLGGRVYGIEGKEYPRVFTGAIGRIVAYLRAHGPTSTADLCAALQMHDGTVSAARKANPDVMIPVGRAPTRATGGNPMSIWGLGDGAA